MEPVGVVSRVRGWTRWVLLGADDSWGATLATGPLGIYMLASFAVLMHVLDLATGLRMMQLYGIELEQNPLARFIMQNAGPIGLIEMKLGVVLAGVLLLVGLFNNAIPFTCLAWGERVVPSNTAAVVSECSRCAC